MFFSGKNEKSETTAKVCRCPPVPKQGISQRTYAFFFWGGKYKEHTKQAVSIPDKRDLFEGIVNHPQQQSAGAPRKKKILDGLSQDNMAVQLVTGTLRWQQQACRIGTTASIQKHADNNNATLTLLTRNRMYKPSAISSS